MTLEGTVVNGKIVLDAALRLTEGLRVRVEIEDEDDIGPADEGFEYPHPLAPYNREKEIALLRESIAEMEAGEKGKSVAEVFDEIDRELGRPANGEG